jgi:hypothetical protein
VLVEKKPSEDGSRAGFAISATPQAEQFFVGQLAGADFAQRRDGGFFTFWALDEGGGSSVKLAGSIGGDQDQIEAVGDAFDGGLVRFMDGDGHGGLLWEKDMVPHF